MTSIKALGMVCPIFLFAACATPTAEVKPAATLAELPHPDAIAGINWKVEDTCVTEYRFGFKRSVHTAVVTDVANGRATFSDTADDGSVRVVVYEGLDGDRLAKRVAFSNGQQSELVPPMKWLNFPLQPGTAWTDQVVAKGQTFQLNLSAKFGAMPWETVTVAAGQFAAVKVVAEETYTAGRNNKGQSFTGNGTVVFWIAPDVKCAVKGQYKNSFGDKTTSQLLSYSSR
jgi:hypothetical protein